MTLVDFFGGGFVIYALAILEMIGIAWLYGNEMSMLSHYHYGKHDEYSTSIPRSEIVDEGHQIHAGH